ncbi:MAG: hypothetical protein LC708_03225, partial [Actinobacteria bacterium]|nr:hypothetical protein [Actinomycetota bacterium]
YLRRRHPASPAAPAGPEPRPATRTPATAGLRVLSEKARTDGDDGGPPTVAMPAPTRPTPGRQAKPAARGPKSGPKSGARAKAALRAQGGVGPTTPTRAEPPAAAAPPAPPAPAAAPPEPQPAIALAESDLWAPGPPGAGAPGEDPWGRAASERAVGAGAPEAAGPGAPPLVPPPPQAGIPPVPAEELSFWDLFPEDLPPARPGGFPEDLLAGFDTGPAAGEPGELQLTELLAAEPEPAAGPTPPAPAREGPAADAETVIAELLDGPVPTPRRAQAGPGTGADDFLISDLLADDLPGADDADEEEEEEEDGPVAAGRSPEEQARIAADRARRRRARRSGRRKRPGPGAVDRNPEAPE